MTEEVFFKDIYSYNIHFLKQFQDFQVPSPYLFIQAAWDSNAGILEIL